MRLRNPELDKIRASHPSYPDTLSGDMFGYFETRGLRIISSGSGEWEHVSVSTATRCPTWAEMDYAKRLFWMDSEIVIQFHVNDDRKVNIHSHALHMWKPPFPIATPPRELV